jgi:L-serine dehydratase
MVGPSSSHTGGAVRIGRVVRRLFGRKPAQVEIVFYGSFAETYSGHGTDMAIAGGLLDYATDDLRIRDALQLLVDNGVEMHIRTGQAPSVHPNTARVKLSDAEGTDEIVGASIGGGNIEITNVNGFDVKFTASNPTLLVFHRDRPGMLADMMNTIMHYQHNIGYMDVDRKMRSGDALTVIETDEAIEAELASEIARLPDVSRVAIVDLTHENKKERTDTNEV